VTSIFNRSSIILHSMDVCHRPDSKPYACGACDSHTPMTIHWTSPSIGLWLGTVLSGCPQARGRAAVSASHAPWIGAAAAAWQSR
jgi:hypothetical protein